MKKVLIIGNSLLNLQEILIFEAKNSGRNQIKVNG